jgi:hypothetical protein
MVSERTTLVASVIGVANPRNCRARIYDRVEPGAATQLWRLIRSQR